MSSREDTLANRRVGRRIQRAGAVRPCARSAPDPLRLVVLVAIAGLVALMALWPAVATGAVAGDHGCAECPLDTPGHDERSEAAGPVCSDMGPCAPAMLTQPVNVPRVVSRHAGRRPVVDAAPARTLALACDLPPPRI